MKSAADEFEKSFYEEMIEDNRKEIKFGILSKKEDLTADEKKELEKLDNYLFPKIQVSAKLYPETHKQLKIRATTEDTTIDKMATSIIEDRIHDLDIAKYVEKEFENINDSRQSVHLGSDHWNKMEEKFREEYEEVYEYLAEKGKSIAMKRINVKVYLSTHKKLGVIGAIENKSLGTLVSEYLEQEFGFIDIQDQNERMDEIAREILLKELEKAVGAEKVSEITEIIPDINSTVLVRTLKSLEEK
ncbi:hypothetical protein [uncultured Methanobrevibacter sp.]|uniref:hypothetical protein n=1 Tax=uncultured Methanobrevibacter sp. TaxID=253161 RepID=UPI0025D212D5|nr:hypothetical protein [uncultured Methanobrevibacter sp.]